MPYCIPKTGDVQEWFHGADDKAPHSLDWVLSASTKTLEWDGEWVQWAMDVAQKEPATIYLMVLYTDKGLQYIEITESQCYREMNIKPTEKPQ